MTWKEAIARVLEESGEPMRARDIAEAIAARGLKTTEGATPTQTIFTQLAQEIARGEEARFRRVGKGLYSLVGAPTPSSVSADQGDADPDDPEVPLTVRAYGVFWERDQVDWKPTQPPLYGQQTETSTRVDFAGQRGVYLLHDGRQAVYVGRVIDRPLALRLREHTRSRLRARWDRFSWFGLYPVNEKGALDEPPSDSADLASCITMLEAVLIEVLEPGLNRQGGQTLASAEFLQVEDPRLVERRHNEMVATLLASRGG